MALALQGPHTVLVTGGTTGSKWSSLVSNFQQVIFPCWYPCFDKALECVDSVSLPDPRQQSSYQAGHCFMQEGRDTRAAERLQAAFTFVGLALKISFSNELGTGRCISALSDPLPRSHIKDKRSNTANSNSTSWVSMSGPAHLVKRSTPCKSRPWLSVCTACALRAYSARRG